MAAFCGGILYEQLGGDAMFRIGFLVCSLVVGAYVVFLAICGTKSAPGKRGGSSSFSDGDGPRELSTRLSGGDDTVEFILREKSTEDLNNNINV